jgi:hypothetical protein
MTNFFKGKTIILAITPDISIYNCFVDNLEHLGFEVFLICNTDKFRYKNLNQRVINFFRKTFLNDKFYKRELSRRYFLEKNLNQLSKIDSVDFTLTIRADLFDVSVLKKIISKSNKNFAYQWDGLNRFPEIKNVITLFDKFYVFDKKDLNHETKTYPATNFYFDCYQTKFKSLKTAPKYDAYFIGSYDDRVKKLLKICDFLESHNLKLNIILCTSPKKHLQKYSYIKYIKKRLSYIENLEMINNSKMLIDIHYDKLHEGLSLRAFDSIGFDKKLITSNENIKKYDFYSKKNIFVINEKPTDFDFFLNSSYDNKQKEIKEKYSFSNWIKYILNEGDFFEIDVV